MTLRKIVILSLALLLTLTADAQKRKKRTAPKKPVIEEPQEDPRITNMREMTQRIIIIDSIVTDKDRFLAQMPLSTESGTVMSHVDFLPNKAYDGGYAFVNEMGNKAYLAASDRSGVLQLFTTDKLGGKWSAPVPLLGISEGLDTANYPFMLNDGTTLYFAAKGEESIGGYDIFLTRYDSHNSRFFKPENIGMPFNSEANDYMLAIDELNRIGYFVSDRRQPEGKVCVYVFIPTEVRNTYDASRYTEEQIRKFADITAIADTWGNGHERQQALARFHNIGQQSSAVAKVDAEDVIVINDRITYTSTREFKAVASSGLYKELLAVRQRLNTLNDELEKAREHYSKANPQDRQALNHEILQAEEEVLQLTSRAKTIEKQIRNAENKVIN